jgi:glycosyltransferase involved in cell wall biosynthesis
MFSRNTYEDRQKSSNTISEKKGYNRARKMEKIAKKKLLVDGTLLTNTPSGIGISTEKTIDELGVIIDICAIVRSGYRKNRISAQIETYVLPNYIPRILYIHLLLPIFALIKGYQKVWIPSPRVPLLHFCQSYYITLYDNTWKFFPETMRPIQAFLEKVQIPFAIRHAKKVFVISNSVLIETQKILGHNASNLETVHLSIGKELHYSDVAHYTELERSSRPYFVFIGTMEPRKNLSRLIEAFNHPSLEKYILVIAGVKRSDLSLANQENVIFIEKYISNGEKNSLIKNAIALCFPSLYEGFGLPILEANLSSVPTLLSDIPIMHEVGSDTGVYVDPLSVDSIRAGIIRLIETRGSFDSQRFERNLSRFSFQKTAEILHAGIFE